MKPTRLALLLGASLLWAASLSAQVEHVPVVHPVYEFLQRAEATGYLGSFSTTVLPLQKKEVYRALARLEAVQEKLSEADREVLAHYRREFEASSPRKVLFASASDSSQILFEGLLSGSEKSIYRNADSESQVNIIPLASLDYRHQSLADSSRSALLGQGGIRLFGTMDSTVGYLLQITNGAVLGGSRDLALQDPALRNNVKFGVLNSDFDFTESHVRVDWKSLYLTIGRENRLIGAGLFNRVGTSTNAAPYDAVAVGARFDHFEYRFQVASLLGQANQGWSFGYAADIPSKYYLFHRFAVKGSWGEVAFNEYLITSGRGLDLGYANPLSFFKGLEHAYRDRDNSALGVDVSLRPIAGLMLRGSFFLDDLIFSEIGNDYWGNKSAWSIGGVYTFRQPFDLAVEYSVVYPYTFSHFNPQNNFTNDGSQFMGSLPPNSDEVRARLRYWYGGRYPISLTVANFRHGRNTYAPDGTIVRNVGGDIRFTNDKFAGDSPRAPFLDGDLLKRFSVELAGGIELVRSINLQAAVSLLNDNAVMRMEGRLMIRYEDF